MRPVEQLVAPAEQTLEALVRDELRGPVAELVRRLVHELVAEQLIGGPSLSSTPRASGGAEETTASSQTTAAKVCGICGETKPLDAFERGRRQCKQCRNRAY